MVDFLCCDLPYVIDRSYNKSGSNTMIFIGNKTPNQWGFCSEDDTLLCSLERVLDDAMYL